MKGRQARGQQIGSSKLTSEDVERIRETYSAGGTSYAKLAAEYRVNQTLIGKIVRGEVWRFCHS